MMRILPDQPFPPYTYVPGLQPHPLSDPAGHGQTGPPCDAACTNPEQWPACRPYLYGIDLFNHGYYWEAHEAWESVWIAAGRSGHQADFLKALIKIAAAMVKTKQGQPAGVKRHAQRAIQLLDALDQPADRPEFMGLRLAQVRMVAAAIAESPPPRTGKLAENEDWPLAVALLPSGWPQRD